VSIPTSEIHAEVGLFRPEDPCLHEQAVRPWELLNTPMERGYAFSMTYIKSSELVIYLEEYGSTMRLRGLAPPGMLVVSVPVTLMPDTLFWRSSLNHAGLHCMLPGEIDAHCAKGQRHIILLIDLNLLSRYLAAPVVEALCKRAQSRFLPAHPEEVSALGYWLTNLLRHSQQNPGMYGHPGVVQSLQENLLLRLTRAVNLEETDSRLVLRVNKSMLGLRRALEYMHAHQGERLGMTELCGKIGVSQRSLERAFQATFDMTACSYLRRQRFSEVRRELMLARPGEQSVSQIAYRHGFYELGHFAVHYARLFGEKPSTTLANDCPVVFSPLLA
jgi:AraC-like DNA-binding protein